MNEVFTAIGALGGKLADHVLLCAAALALGILVAIPLAVWASRSATVARIVLVLASLVQTVPALALLALFFPILLSLRAVFGEGLPTLGFLPALLALALYAVLPIMRNAVTAFGNLDQSVLDAADAVGMTRWQKLRLVEGPLIAPFAMAGIRTAAVWTIGAATLATTIGQPSLGDPIFAGLQTQNWSLVVAGCVVAAVLALVTDGVLGLLERGITFRRRLAWMAGLGLLILGIVAAGFARLAPIGGERPAVVIGAKPFSEQYILARLIGHRLTAAGFSVAYRDGLGSAIAHSSVASGRVDILVDYTGTIWANQMKRRNAPPRDAMLAEIIRWEETTNKTLVLGRLGFENAYCLAMRSDRARALGIASIRDLVRYSPQLAIGGDPEFFERPEWFAVRDSYGLAFRNERNFAPTFMYDALRSGEADVIGAYSSDGRIAADRLKVLDDPAHAFPNYDAIVLIGPKARNNKRLISALQPLVDRIEIAAMRQANYSVDQTVNKRTPDEAARQLARSIGL